MKPIKNIVYIITDQQRFEHLGCNGHPLIKTPNIDKIAERGVSFERFYTNNPICMPSRATIITGRTPRSHRVYDNGCRLHESELTIPEFLKGKGWSTGAFGKIHLRPYLNPQPEYESVDYWKDAQHSGEPVPYLGYDHTEICTQHISHVTGQYGRWLAENHPSVKNEWRNYITDHPNCPEWVTNWSLPEETHANAWIAERSCAFIRSQVQASNPFYMHIGFPDPHHPFRAPEPWGSMYSADDISLPCPSNQYLNDKPPEYLEFFRGVLNEEVLGAGDFNMNDFHTINELNLRQIVATTLGMVSFIDAQVGKILSTLDELQILDETMIVFTTDHADYMGDHGMIMKGPFLLEGLIKIPFLISLPGLSAEKVNSKALLSHIDFFPTLLDILGLDHPRGLEGFSFQKLLTGEQKEVQEHVLCEFLHQTMPDKNIKALITEKHKCIVWGNQEYGELYDINDDPLETQNHWNNASKLGIKDDLLKRLAYKLIESENLLPWPNAIS